MALMISVDSLRSFIEALTLESDGDPYEKRYAYIVHGYMPNYERFWRLFVAPATNRVINSHVDATERIRSREGVSQDVKRIGTAHYTVFTKAAYAYRHLSHFTPECLRDYHSSSFEDFYTHLASLCDLAEDFLSNFALLIEATPAVKQHITLDELIADLREWYAKNGGKIYDWYTKKRKPIVLPNRFKSSVLDDYYGKASDEWKQYKETSRLIREYRNYIVHNVRMGMLFPYVNGMSGSGVCHLFADTEHNPPQFPLVPRKEAFRKYPTWDDVLALRSGDESLRVDFIDMKRQMDEDYRSLLWAVNALWERPINDWLSRLFCGDLSVLRHLGIQLASSAPGESSSAKGIVWSATGDHSPSSHPALGPLGAGSGAGVIEVQPTDSAQSNAHVSYPPVNHMPTGSGMGSIRVEPPNQSPPSQDGLPSVIHATIYKAGNDTPIKTVSLVYRNGFWTDGDIRLTATEVIIDGVSQPFQWKTPLDVSVWQGDT